MNNCPNNYFLLWTPFLKCFVCEILFSFLLSCWLQLNWIWSNSSHPGSAKLFTLWRKGVNPLNNAILTGPGPLLWSRVGGQEGVLWSEGEMQKVIEMGCVILGSWPFLVKRVHSCHFSYCHEECGLWESWEDSVHRLLITRKEDTFNQRSSRETWYKFEGKDRLLNKIWKNWGNHPWVTKLIEGLN